MRLQPQGTEASAARAAALRKEARTQKQRFESVLHFTQGGTARPGPAPFDMEVQFARGALRNTYLSLLFTCAFEHEAHNIDVLVWSDTTHVVISAFREQLARLEKEAQGAATKRGAAPKSERRSAKLHEVERVLRDMRRFLDAELRFWERLAVRIVRMFALDELRPVLQRLRLRDADAARSTGRTDAHQAAAEHEANEDAGFQLSCPASKRLAEARTPPNRHRLVEALQRVLIYCGDLARYREMHTPRPAPLVPRRRQHATPRAPDFRRALQLYQEAQRLDPDHGHPANQLAVVALVTKDPFGATYHSYRALCVATPFAHARYNLHKVLEKSLRDWDAAPIRTEALRAWRQTAMVTNQAAHTPLPSVSPSWPTLTAWFAHLVLLHAMLAQGVEVDCAALLGDALARHLLWLAEDQRLEPADYLRVLGTALCAAHCDAPAAGAAHGACGPNGVRVTRAPPFSTGPLTERAALDADTLARWVAEGTQTLRVVHILNLLTSLGALARHALRAGDRTALGRVLPALRIGSKWVRAQSLVLDACAAQSTTRLAKLDAHALPSLEQDGLARLTCLYASLPTRLHSFWAVYADVASLLAAERPETGAPRTLPEDAELGALTMLKGTLHAVPGASDDAARMADVLADADALVARAQLAKNAHGQYSLPEESDDPVAFAMHAMDTQRNGLPREEAPASNTASHTHTPAPGRAAHHNPPASATSSAPLNAHDLLHHVRAPRGPAAWPWTPPPGAASASTPLLLFGSALPGHAPPAAGSSSASIWSATPDAPHDTAPPLGLDPAFARALPPHGHAG